MRLLVIGMDRSVADPSSSSAKRQAAYYKGWEVDILVVAPGESKALEIGPGVRVIAPGGSDRIRAFLKAAAMARKLGQSGVYEVITVQDPFFSGWLGLLALGSGRSRALHVQDHSAAFARASVGWKDRILQGMSSFVLRRASRVRTVSQRGKRGLIEQGIDESKVDVVPVASDLQKFFAVSPSPSQKPTILSVGRLNFEKGMDVLLHAMPEVIKAVPEVNLQIIGDGPERTLLEAQSKKLGIDSHVEFLGRREDIEYFLQKAWVYVQPSRYEGWGIAVIEASAAQVPVVMTDVGCAGEIIKHDESGFVVPTEDPAALARALVSSLTNREIAKRFAGNAFTTVSKLPTTDQAIGSIKASLEKTKGQKSNPRLWPLFAVAFMIRFVLWGLILSTVGPKGFELGDSQQYLGLAQSLLEGNGFALDGVPFFYRTIGYPLFLAIGLALFRSTAGFVLFQVFLASFIPLLVWKLGKSLKFGERAALLAAWIAVLEPHMVYYSVTILTETVFTLIFFLGLLAIFRLMKTKRPIDSVFAGIAFGLSLIVKPLFQLFPPVLFVLVLPWFRKIDWKNTLKQSAIIFLTAFVLITPWMYRNQRAFGSFSLSSQGSSAALFYLGTSIVSVRDHVSYQEAEAKVTQEFRQKYPANLSDKEKTQAMGREATEYIKAYPSILMRLIVINTVTLWTSVNYNSFLNYYRVIPPVDHSVLPPTHYLAQGRIGDLISSSWKIFSQPFYFIGALGRVFWLIMTGLFLHGIWKSYRNLPEQRFKIILLVALCLYLTAVIWVDGLGIEARLRFSLMPIEFLFAAYSWTLLRKKI